MPSCGPAQFNHVAALRSSLGIIGDAALWLMLFNREPQTDLNALKHTTLATSRLRFLFIAAKIWRHAGRTGVSYSDHYEEKTTFQRLMSRLRNIVSRPPGFTPVIVAPLC